MTSTRFIRIWYLRNNRSVRNQPWSVMWNANKTSKYMA